MVSMEQVQRLLLIVQAWTPCLFAMNRALSEEGE